MTQLLDGRKTCKHTQKQEKITDTRMKWIQEKQECLVVALRVIPRASKDGFQGVLGDALKVRIQAPPVEGKANTYLLRFLAKQWKIPKSTLEILSGETGRNKRIRIKNPPEGLKEQILLLENT